MKKNNIFVMKPKPRLYFSSLVYFLLLLLVGYFAVLGVDGALHVFLIATGGFSVFEAFKYARRVIIVDGDIIQERNFMISTDKLKLDDVKSFEVKIGVFNYFDRFKPTVRLEIYSKSVMPTLIIAIKLFDEKDVTDLMRILSLAIGEK